MLAMAPMPAMPASWDNGGGVGGARDERREGGVRGMHPFKVLHEAYLSNEKEKREGGEGFPSFLHSAAR